MGFGKLRKQAAPGLLVLMGVMSLLIAGCGSSSSGTSPLPDSQQIFRFPLNANGVDIKTMDPAQVQDYYSYFPVELVYPSLLSLSAQGTPYPWAATAMPSFDTSTNTYTFTVRSGLKWTDGTPIDANTFAYSINRALSPCTASPVTYYLFAIKDAPTFATEKCASDGVTVNGAIKTSHR